MRTNLLVSAEPDGLPPTPIRRWALDKYRLVALYSRLFSTGMKRKWPVRVYIDLCAGSGFSELEETKQLYRGSPLLALGVPDPFDNYIFCEEDPDSLRALTRRTGRLFPQSNVRIIEGNCDEQLGKIAVAIPTGPGVLSFCFADPFDLSIKFSTVEHLASGRVDFLFVLALHMDANRNIAHYVQGENRKIGKEPRVIFTCSWSDFFIEEADPWREEAWDIIRSTPHHTYQILTKRPERIKSHLPDCWPLSNVWLGVSVENPRFYWRIATLCEIPVTVRFLSLEPLLAPMPDIPLSGISWVIVGGESGPRCRPILADWVCDIRNRCRDARIPFFFKQWGGARKRLNGRTLEGRTWDELPNLQPHFNVSIESVL